MVEKFWMKIVRRRIILHYTEMKSSTLYLEMEEEKYYVVTIVLLKYSMQNVIHEKISSRWNLYGIQGDIPYRAPIVEVQVYVGLNREFKGRQGNFEL